MKLFSPGPLLYIVITQAASKKKANETCVTDFSQVYSEKRIVGTFQLEIQSRMSLGSSAVTNKVVVLEQTANVTLLLSVAPMRVSKLDAASWQFLLQYDYNVPNTVGEYNSFHVTTLIICTECHQSIHFSDFTSFQKRISL